MDVNEVQALTAFDQSFAAYLLCAGIRLVRVLPGYWCHYEFDDADGQASLCLVAWKTGTATVKAREYANALRQIKQLTKKINCQSVKGDANNDYRGVSAA